MKKPFNPVQQKARRDKQRDWHIRTRDRSGRMPLTLIDASTVANAARDLRVIASSMHTSRPCYAQHLQIIATQIAEATNAAGAIAAHPETPSSSAAHAEITQAEITLSEITLSEKTLSEPSV